MWTPSLTLAGCRIINTSTILTKNEEMEELPKETWDDKFHEAVEDLQRAGVRPTGSEDNEDGGNNEDNGDEGEEEEKYP